MAERDRVAEYTVPKTRMLRWQLLWRLRRMRDSVDVETMEVFEHELAAYERAGIAELERQRSRNAAACAARVAEARTREELVRAAIVRSDEQVKRAERSAERLDSLLFGRDPGMRNHA